MDLKKLPPSMLVVLGLACARSQPPTVGPCLSQPYDPATDVGPCLSPPEDPGDPGTTGEPTEPPDPDTGTEPDTGDEPPMHPCLSPIPPGQASDALGASMAARAPEAPSAPAATRGDAIERVLARATLPADVAERLRRRTDTE
jgi:hypothetical protein